MKKNFFSKSNPDNKNRIIRFLEKKGFYIILFMCVIIIGITAFFVTKENMQYYSSNDYVTDSPEPENQKEVEETSSTSNNEILEVSGVSNSEEENSENTQQSENKKGIETSEQNTKNESLPVIVQQPDTKNEGKKQDRPQESKQDQSQVTQLAAEEKDKSQSLKFMMPVQGEIILEFSGDKLIYSKTLDEYRTHNGIDIHGNIGTQVKAVASGTVERVYKENGMGITILIDHGNGLKTKYCNLSSDNIVKENQKVNQGDVISGIGNTALFEISEQPHLHFEVIKDDKLVDPKEYLFN